MILTKIHSACAFTGHRPAGLPAGGDESAYETVLLKKSLKKWICELYGLGTKEFLTGCALGIDLWAGEIVLELQKSAPDIILHSVIPYMGQARAFEKDMRGRWERMIEESNKVTIISSVYSKGVFRERNKFLVDNSGVLIAVCASSAASSGTAQTLRYAQKCGREIIRINPLTAEAEV